MIKIYLFILLTIIIYKYIFKNIYIIPNVTNKNNVNIFRVKNLREYINSIKDIDKIVNLEENKPNYIDICEIYNKGWGLKTNKYIKKNEIIYECPVSFFSNKYNTKIITNLGHKYVSPKIHSGINILNRYSFTYWDILINHNNNANCNYYKNINIKNGKPYILLYALKDINKNTELTINYDALYINYLIYRYLLF